jgi:hypothetical protein
LVVLPGAADVVTDGVAGGKVAVVRTGGPVSVEVLGASGVVDVVSTAEVVGFNVAEVLNETEVGSTELKTKLLMMVGLVLVSNFSVSVSVLKGLGFPY